MTILNQIEPANQFRDLFGGSFNEVAAKVAIGIVTILWSVANDTAYLLFIFLLLLTIDAVLGVILSQKKKVPFNGFYVFAGPGFKLIITSAVMVAMAILDNLIRSTPVGAIVTQPLTIGVGGAVCFAMGYAADYLRFQITSVQAGVYTSWSSLGVSGTWTYRKGLAGAYAAPSGSVVLSAGDWIEIKRTINTADGVWTWVR